MINVIGSQRCPHFLKTGGLVRALRGSKKLQKSKVRGDRVRVNWIAGSTARSTGKFSKGPRSVLQEKDRWQRK
jgi:hypothetical protein